LHAATLLQNETTQIALKLPLIQLHIFCSERTDPHNNNKITKLQPSSSSSFYHIPSSPPTTTRPPLEFPLASTKTKPTITSIERHQAITLSNGLLKKLATCSLYSSSFFCCFKGAADRLCDIQAPVPKDQFRTATPRDGLAHTSFF
jgi:hypothetical protein